MDLKLANRNVVITGGSRGIGKAIAVSFAAEGANVSISARNKNDIDKTLAELKKFPNRYIGHAIDIQNRKLTEKWLNATVAELGGIDILILNASALSTIWSTAINVDLMGTIQTMEIALPFLRKSREASVIFVSSVAASTGIPGVEPYGAMKAALVNYMKSLSQALNKENIRVNVVSPGNVYFENGHWDQLKQANPKEYNDLEAACGFKRMASPEEVADCIVFLSSSRASYVSGANLLIDGGGKNHVVL